MSIKIQNDLIYFLYIKIIKTLNNLLPFGHTMERGSVDSSMTENRSTYNHPMYSMDLMQKVYDICQENAKHDQETSLLACTKYKALFSSLFHNSSSEEEYEYELDLAFEKTDSFVGRFIPYTILTCLAVIFNVISVAAMIKIRAHWACHHLLLLNLAVCDIVGAVLLWMYHNSPVLFPHFTVTSLSHCLFISIVLAAPFILTLCNSSYNLLLLALNLYVVICHPLFSATKLTKTMIRLFILITWLCSLLCSAIPLMAMLYRNQTEDCKTFINPMAVKALEICAYVLVTVIIIAITLYGRIYHVILRYRKSTNGLHRSQQQTRSRNRNYKAFLTTLLLAGALFVFWVPYMIFSFITAHLDIADIPDAVLYVKFYFIDFLPVMHFLTDPAIYGLRIMEIRRGYKKLFCKHKLQHRHYHSSMETRSTLMRNSLLSVDTTHIASSEAKGSVYRLKTVNQLDPFASELTTYNR